MSVAVERLRTLGICLVQAVAAALLALAAMTLPWATFRTARATSELRGGPISVLLVVLAALVILHAALAILRASPLVYGVQVAIGCSAIVASIALALSKIASSNHLALVQDGPSQTAYAIGGPVAIAASLVIVICQPDRVGRKQRMVAPSLAPGSLPPARRKPAGTRRTIPPRRSQPFGILSRSTSEANRSATAPNGTSAFGPGQVLAAPATKVATM